MTTYEEILQLRKELKRPGVFQHNKIQLRMLTWHFTIICSFAFKRFMDMCVLLVVWLSFSLFL